MTADKSWDQQRCMAGPRRAPWRLGLAIVLCSLSLSGEASGQSDTASGALRGVAVAADEGSALAAVTILVEEIRTGYRTRQETSADGRFQIRLLPPGLYAVRAERAGYLPFELRGVRVGVGAELSLVIELRAVAFSEEIQVEDTLALLETTRTSLADVVDDETISLLPLDGRDFKDLALLSPQVIQTSPDTFSGLGEEHSSTSFSLDGAAASSLFLAGPVGGIASPFTISRTAIQEFQVLRSSYDPRFGGASGILVNAVTKRGGNTLHGTAHSYFQDDDMVATDVFGNGASGFSRHQAGLSFSGPIRRDRAHFFVALDSQRRDDDFDRSPQRLDPELQTPFENRLRELGLDPSTEFDYLTTSDAEVLTARFDWAHNDRHRTSLRGNWLDYVGENSAWGGSRWVGASSNGPLESATASTTLALSSVLGSRWFNEASLQWSSEDSANGSNSTDLPWAVVGAGADTFLGQSNFLPSTTDEQRFQLQDNLTWVGGDHTLRTGFDAEVLDTTNQFCFNCGGFYFFPDYAFFLSGTPLFYSQGFSPVDGLVDLDTELFSFYVGEEWQPGPKLTIELGLRLQNQDNPSPKTSNPLEPRTRFVPDDTDLAPRLGFAWDPGGRGRSVVRGGVGLFHSWTPSLLAANVLLSNGINNRVTNLFLGHPLLPTYPQRLSPDLPGLSDAPPDLFLFATDFENPETLRASLAVEHVLADNWTVAVEGTFSESRHRVRNLDANLDPTPLGLTPDNRPIYGGARARVDPSFGQKIQFTSDAEAEHVAISLIATKRLAQGWSFRGHYTYAELKDHDSFEFDALFASPEDFYDLDQDWGPSTQDLRHRIVVTGSYRGPFGITLSGFGRYRSGVPVNPLVSEDTNNDGFFSDRPGPDPALGLDRHLSRNSFRGRDWWHLDLRVAKAIEIIGRHRVELMIEVFNLAGTEVLVAPDSLFARGGQRNPNFLEPTIDFMPRSVQLGVRYSF